MATLSAYPPASQAYTTTATYESMLCRKLFNKCDKPYEVNLFNGHAIPVQGQFEDAE